VELRAARKNTAVFRATPMTRRPCCAQIRHLHRQDHLETPSNRAQNTATAGSGSIADGTNPRSDKRPISPESCTRGQAGRNEVRPLAGMGDGGQRIGGDPQEVETTRHGDTADRRYCNQPKLSKTRVMPDADLTRQDVTTVPVRAGLRIMSDANRAAGRMCIEPFCMLVSANGSFIIEVARRRYLLS
jgi:hypothetical protein